MDTSEMTDHVLLDALDRLHDTGPEFNDFLANRGPVAAEALIRLGGSDAVPAWVDHYLPRLGPAPTVVEGLSNTNWREHLGEVRLTGDWTGYLRQQARDLPWHDLLQRWWPRLLPGMAASTRISVDPSRNGRGERTGRYPRSM